jgi:hypothetical protein
VWGCQWGCYQYWILESLHKACNITQRLARACIWYCFMVLLLMDACAICVDANQVMAMSLNFQTLYFVTDGWASACCILDAIFPHTQTNYICHAHACLQQRNGSGSLRLCLNQTELQLHFRKRKQYLSILRVIYCVWGCTIAPHDPNRPPAPSPGYLLWVCPVSCFSVVCSHFVPLTPEACFILKAGSILWIYFAQPEIYFSLYHDVLPLYIIFLFSSFTRRVCVKSKTTMYTQWDSVPNRNPISTIAPQSTVAKIPVLIDIGIFF